MREKLISDNDAARSLFWGAYVTSPVRASKMPMWNKYIKGLQMFPIAGYTNVDCRPKSSILLRYACTCHICIKSTPRLDK